MLARRSPGQAFDAVNAKTIGEPFAIAPAVRFFLTTGLAAFSASGHGSIVFQPLRDTSRTAWVDRTGDLVQDVGAPASHLDLWLAPSGREALVSRALPATGTYDIWSLDLARGTETRVTVDDVSTEIGGLLLPGGQEMIYSSPRGSAAAHSPKPHHRRGSSDAASVLRFRTPKTFRPTGLHAGLYEHGQRRPTSGPQPPRSPKPALLRPSPFHHSASRFLRMAATTAILSLESGRSEVYASPLSGGVATRISKDGATDARWSRDGHELLYLSLDGRMLSVPVRTNPVLDLGAPSTLFGVGKRGWLDFEVAPDGRFLALIPALVANEQPLKAMMNWSPKP